ncbi:CRISPR-associated helicase Cas3' [Defluviitalea raffinosedens]|jgi:CRISPR-associated endonuclease/helicase Cas3|uniref:CRISPR-associated helicase Cas3' n=1 Tax=Defluviitalea raffinosedens TaxID=1450156 RepID=UPI00195A0A79|nr:CRISPR-associated helicase Cas3' [Defluviitalea raffinosedens]MBM7685904.1 CRISPR-associated endonuclease/helicase Cas3 [Defluviitalea raffinosedens]MBZ4668694.1 CRISPR-associated helicase Cas3 [Defluviitaleaceae bacterium]
MEKELSSSNLYSHPGKALEEHLIRTTEIILEQMEDVKIKNIGKWDYEVLRKLSITSSLLHDFGKSTEFFQEYLTAAESKQKQLKSKPQTHHSLLSAAVNFLFIKAEIEQDTTLSDEDKNFLSFIAFLIVRRHHGDLGNIVQEAVIGEDEIKVLVEQAAFIDSHKLEKLQANLQKVNPRIQITKEKIINEVKNITGSLRKIKKQLRKLGDQKRVENYIAVNYLFSLLIDADKTEAAVGKYINRPALQWNEKLVDYYKSLLPIKPSKLNDTRQEAYDEIMEKSIHLSQRIYSINLPTGLGKTFCSVAFALKLREKIQNECNITPRIIYCLPFLSVIDQNASIIEDILKKNGVDASQDILLKHHHLSECYFRSGESEFESNEARILIEGWNSEIIVTTFVQFFHTLISNSNKMIRKFHRLSNSIILLDEIQSVPFKYWLLIKELLNVLAHQLNSYIVFITATQPMIFPPHEVASLVNREKYFELMNRIVIKPMIEKEITLQELISQFTPEKNKSYLFIFNTIPCAKNFFELLSQREDVKEEIVFLSTHVTPCERLQRIKKMKEGKVRFAVTTQLVEAGVDIDFDVVYRDLAPMDCINQSAGRCNRNANTTGEVIIVSLRKENQNRTFASMVYDYMLLDITKKILGGKNVIEEKELLNIIEEYYSEVNRKLSEDRARELLEAIYKMRYESTDDKTGISDFKLIENDYSKIDVFIEIDDYAESLWSRFCDIQKIQDKIERKNEFDKIKGEFYKYVISIPAYIDNKPQNINGIGYVNRYSLKDYYDHTTGFKCEAETLIW